MEALMVSIIFGMDGSISNKLRPQGCCCGEIFFFVVNTPLYSFQRCENDACSYWSVLDVGPQADLVKKDLLLVISFMMMHTTESDITIFIYCKAAVLSVFPLYT